MLKSVFALAAIAVSVPALAADGAAPFSGPYIGVQGGWQQDRQRLDVTKLGVLSSSSQNKDGFAYGGQLGYDFHLTPNVVLGAELGLTGRTGSSLLDPASNLTLKQGRTITTTARLGYMVGAQGLLYARGGYANARYTLNNPTTNISENRDGYTVGLGYEQQLMSNVSARIEYAYSRFGSDNLPAVAANLGANSAVLKYRRNAVTAGLNFRF